MVNQAVILNCALQNKFNELKLFQSRKSDANQLDEVFKAIIPLLQTGKTDLVFLGDIINDRCSLLPASRVMTYIIAILKNSNVKMVLGNHDAEMFDIEKLLAFKNNPNYAHFMLQSGLFAQFDKEEMNFTKLKELFREFLTSVKVSYFDQKHNAFYIHNGFKIKSIEGVKYLITAMAEGENDTMNYIELNKINSWQKLSELINTKGTSEFLSNERIMQHFTNFRPDFNQIRESVKELNEKFGTKVKVIYGHNGDFNDTSDLDTMTLNARKDNKFFIVSVTKIVN